MAWKTYLILYFGTNNKSPTEMAKHLEDLGFTTSIGAIDFIYEWENNPPKEQILELADKVAEALKDSGAVFNIDTRE